jgi:Prion-inhibition and propagation
MAEAAGLAFGGVALASLLSTCVEFLEYLENGKNWTKDFQLALTKVSLLKTRLSQWGTSIAMSIGSFEAQVLQERWPEESGAITTTLLGIKEIIGSTTQMCRRYDSDKDSLEHRWRIDNDTQDGQSCQSHSSFYPSFPEDQFPTSSGSSHSSDLSTDRPRRREIIRTFRLKVIWALQDKKRFDSLINDFDFLLRNLERIGERLLEDNTAMEGAKADVCYPTGKRAPQ